MAGFAFFVEDLFFDDGLGGDAGVVGAGHPKGIITLHAAEPNEDVLEGVVEGVAHVEGAGDVGRGYDDGIGGGIIRGVRGRVGVETSLAAPELVGLIFDGGRFVCF